VCRELGASFPSRAAGRELVSARLAMSANARRALWTRLQIGYIRQSDENHCRSSSVEAHLFHKILTSPILIYIYKYQNMKSSSVISSAGALAQARRTSFGLGFFGGVLWAGRGCGAEGARRLTAGEIGHGSGNPPPMSFHLKQLRFAGLVSSRRESTIDHLQRQFQGR